MTTLLPKKETRRDGDELRLGSGVYTLTNMLGLTGKGYIQLADMLHDQVAVLVKTEGDYVIFESTGHSPVLFTTISIERKLPRFIFMRSGHQYSIKILEIGWIQIPCVNSQGKNTLATLKFDSQSRNSLWVTLEL